MKAAVLGSPVAHSLSPALHRAAYAELGLDDWTYEAVEPRVVPVSAAADWFRASDQRFLRLFGVDQCLLLRTIDTPAG